MHLPLLLPKPFTGKKEVSDVYAQRNQGRTERRPTVGAVMIQKYASDQPRNNQPRNDQPRNNQQRVERLIRKFTKINMTLAQVLPHILKLNLAMLKEAPKNPNTTSPHYHLNAKCAYHSESPGHEPTTVGL